jgi:hypothetical protein
VQLDISPIELPPCKWRISAAGTGAVEFLPRPFDDDVLLLSDKGASVGFRLAVLHPERGFGSDAERELHQQNR